MKWIAGLNGAGKSVYLENLIDEKATQADVVTNLRDAHYTGFDEHRIGMLREMDNYDIITNYGDLKVIGNELIIDTEGFEYTDSFKKILNLLCRKGDCLIVDEPEFGLYGVEISFLVDILYTLIKTYKDGAIATHCQSLFCIEPDNFYWCSEYKLKKIKKEQLYGSIGQF